MNNRLSCVFAVIIVMFSLIFYACPELEEDPVDDVLGGYIMAYNVELTYGAWIEILTEISEQDQDVRLDLSNCSTSELPGVYHAFINWRWENAAKTRSFDFRVFNPAPWMNDLPYDEEADEVDAAEIYRSAKSKIVSVILPRTATMIGIGDGPNSAAFKGFTNLRSIEGERIVFIGDYAFYGLQNLRNARFLSAGDFEVNPPPAPNPNSADDVSDENGFLRSIGEFAFYGCSSLTEVDFPDAKIIGRNAFAYCTGLTEITQANLRNVWRIEQGAFRGCTNLVSIYFRNATKISSEAFLGCTSLREARFMNTQKQYITGVHPLQPFLENPNSPNPPFNYDSVVFDRGAFSGCKALERLEIPYAWNVYFAADALADIGTHLELHLFDDDGAESFGHPQTDDYFGHRTGSSALHSRSLTSIKIVLPRVEDESQFRSDEDYYTDCLDDPPCDDMSNCETRIQIARLFHDIRGRYGEDAIEIEIARY